MISETPKGSVTIVQFPPFRNPFLLPAAVLGLLLIVLIVVVSVRAGNGHSIKSAEYQAAVKEYHDAVHLHKIQVDHWDYFRSINASKETLDKAKTEIAFARTLVRDAKAKLEKYNIPLTE
jgi:hypothetical protein